MLGTCGRHAGDSADGWALAVAMLVTLPDGWACGRGLGDRVAMLVDGFELYWPLRTRSGDRVFKHDTQKGGKR